MDKKTLTILVLCILGYYFLFSNSDENIKKLELDNINASKKVLSPVQNILESDPKQLFSNSRKNEDEENLNANINDFQNWFEEEAKKIEIESIDSSLLAQQIKNKAKAMSAKELEYLKEQYLNADVGASNKIFASYMLSEAGPTGLDTMAEAVLNTDAPLGQPDSLDEVRSAQAKAAGIMLIDGIFKSETDILTRIEKLSQIIDQSSVESLKEYASEKRRQLQKMQVKN